MPCLDSEALSTVQTEFQIQTVECQYEDQCQVERDEFQAQADVKAASTAVMKINMSRMTTEYCDASSRGIQLYFSLLSYEDKEGLNVT
jgi:hypothetical protein